MFRILNSGVRASRIGYLLLYRYMKHGATRLLSIVPEKKPGVVPTRMSGKVYRAPPPPSAGQEQLRGVVLNKSHRRPHSVQIV